MARTVLLRGAKFDIERLRYPGRDGAFIERECVRHPGSVIVLPLLEDGRVVMIRQWRATIEREILELPAGTCGWGEPAAECAARELIEETGYRASELAPLLDFLPVPGLADEVMSAFVARGLVAVGARPEVDERIRVEHPESSRVLEMVDRGEVVDGKTMLVLLLAARRGLI